MGALGLTLICIVVVCTVSPSRGNLEAVNDAALGPMSLTGGGAPGSSTGGTGGSTGNAEPAANVIGSVYVLGSAKPRVNMTEELILEKVDAFHTRRENIQNRRARLLSYIQRLHLQLDALRRSAGRNADELKADLDNQLLLKKLKAGRQSLEKRATIAEKSLAQEKALNAKLEEELKSAKTSQKKQDSGKLKELADDDKMEHSRVRDVELKASKLQTELGKAEARLAKAQEAASKARATASAIMEEAVRVKKSADQVRENNQQEKAALEQERKEDALEAKKKAKEAEVPSFRELREKTTLFDPGMDDSSDSAALPFSGGSPDLDTANVLGPRFVGGVW